MLWKWRGRDLVDMGPFIMTAASQKKAENLEIHLVPTMPSFLVSFFALVRTKRGGALGLLTSNPTLKNRDRNTTDYDHLGSHAT